MQHLKHLDEVMIGGTVGEVVESKNAKFKAGDSCRHVGWTEMGVDQMARILKKVDTSHIPMSAYLGAVGMPGMTAWYGLNKLFNRKRVTDYRCFCC
jgi:NADPH-dependent curcumin reductase